MRIEEFYAKTSPQLLFKGRPGDTRLGEWVKSERLPLTTGEEIHVIALWGCPDDAGVVANRGRAGARMGPDSIRKHLYKMTPPMDLEWDEAIRLVDVGNLIPVSRLLETQSRCESVVSQICASGATLIALGGGHDFAAPNFLGFLSGIGASARKKAGLINIDPHLDVRPLENGQPHSGTPFRQILESGKMDPKLFIQFGARANRNARNHHQYCERKGVGIYPYEALREQGIPMKRLFEKQLKALTRKCAFAGITIDMDGCADAEGTSAAPVIGFSAQELVEFSRLAGSNPKIKYFEIAEVAPSLDPSERSSRIAAEMVYAFLQSRAQEILS